MLRNAAAHPAIPPSPAPQRAERLLVRGGAAGWLLVMAALVVPGTLGDQGAPALRWSAVGVLVAASAVAAALPLERVPRAAQAGAAWVAVLMVVGLQLGLRGAAPDIALLTAPPLVWLASRHDWSALLAGIGIAAATAIFAWLSIPADTYGPIAVGAAILLALGVKVLTRQGAETVRFSSLAFTDPVTNCPNRRAWEFELPGRLQAALGRDRTLAAAVLDLDRFTAYNEDWGHAAGDRLLTDVATGLRFAQSADPDASGLGYIARVGADEFGLVLEGQSAAQAGALVHRLDLPGGCTVSLGIAFWDRHETAEDLTGRALRALAAAKRTGGGRVVVDDGAGARVNSWLDAVPAIVARSEVESVYQPIRDLRSNRLVGYEALARPTGAPSDLEVDGMFTAARRLGVSRELESICQSAALNGAHRLLARGGSLFINVSVGSLTEAGLGAMLEQLHAAHLRPAQVVLEVNEQVTRLDRFAQACALYRRAGFRFAMDDVGEGLSTIEALAAVEPEIIKIAKSLVSSADDPGSAAVIRGLVETARSLGGRIIAEGIESAADAARMLNLGATLGQGWALGTPARLGEALVRAAAERPEPVTAQAPARQLAGPVRLAPVRPRAG